ncbi:hypothetical protein HAX54_036144 [Datura stramonium]|uniref:Uncharacterized protein n=1 Tax=Datura stramonium TaxID=4076 RepID=A0ABS8VHU5_DATST|nr:hypothetical protein [Datura stramonium]
MQKKRVFELLTGDVVDKFSSAWAESQKTVIFPIYLRIDKEGNFDYLPDLKWLCYNSSCLKLSPDVM